MNKQQYFLMLLMEEASEVAQAASKCVRFTPEHAYYDKSNIERLDVELTDFFTVLELVEASTGYKFCRLASTDKLARITEYVNISQHMGVLNGSDRTEQK